MELVHAGNAAAGVIAPGSSAACVRCGQPIGDQWVPILDSVCHPQCFCCETCGENVEERYCLFEDIDEKQHLLCEKHYFERTNLVCAKCKEPLDSMYVHAMGRKYHPDHFTCTACPTIFGPNGTYYEHDGDAYCLYHYTYLVAKKCAGCQQPIMKLFLQINNRGIDEHWHPECYMIYKFWNVRIFPGIYAGVRGRVAKQLLKPQNAVSEQQIYQVWTVLSSFEESTATCISDMLLQVSGGHYLEGLRQAERFIMHVDVLFASIDDLEDELSHFDDSTGLQHTREPKLLCKKIVSFFSVLSHTQSNESNGLTQELLSLVTSLAHYLKVLTRVALKGALKAQTEYKCPSSIKALLSKLTETSDRQKWALFRLSYQETDIASDLCTACHGPVESECIEHMRKKKRWHLYCFVCTSCNCEIQHVYPQSAYDEAAGTLFCPACGEKNGVAPGGFKFVSQLEQYSFLMRVALKRLYGLLKMKNALEHPNMARYRKGDARLTKNSADKAQEELRQIASPELADNEAVKATKEAANKEFDAALEKMDRLELKQQQQQQQQQQQTAARTPELDLSRPEAAKGEFRAIQGAEREPLVHGSGHQDASAELHVSTDGVGMQRRPSNTPGAAAGDLGNTLSPLSPEMVSAVATAAVEEAKSDGSIVQMRETDVNPPPPQSMLSRPHTMRFLSDLNTAELFCAKHVAVARLSALLGGQSEFSQADLVALIGAPKKASATGMWSRLKTNLKKKDGSTAGGSGGGGKDRMRTATFGVPLEALIERQGVETDLGAHGKQNLQIPQFFEQMLMTLTSMDLAVEGIFRKNGNIRRLREVTEAVDKDYSRVDLRKDTPVQIAALLKKFLRELPDPVIPFRMRRLFLAIAAVPSARDRFEAFRYAVVLLPQANRDMLNVLTTFLNWVATFSHVDEQSGSKMDTLNLATVITPNILYADVKEPTRDRDDTFSYEACNVIQQLMEAGESLWLVPDAIIAFLRDNSSEFAEGVSELNTKELLRRCERQIQQQVVGSSSGSSGPPMLALSDPEP
ncbi:RhoGAP-domain-containing protein [Martensiomyces pterosporus]|nr:RhoGAP-domain-containing protein [Martensiomyces pterosporus]